MFRVEAETGSQRCPRPQGQFRGGRDGQLALPAPRAMFRMGAGHASFGVMLCLSYARAERLTALRIARIEAVAVLVSMPTPHRTWPPVWTST